jgi:hypothetical protein
MTALATILLFFGVMALASLLFGGWVIVSVVRLLGQGIGFLLGGDRGTVAEVLPGGVERRCGNRLCRANNPVSARFCRRCGRSMVGGPEAGAAPMGPARMPAPPVQWDTVGELTSRQQNRI